MFSSTDSDFSTALSESGLLGSSPLLTDDSSLSEIGQNTDGTTLQLPVEPVLDTSVGSTELTEALLVDDTFGADSFGGDSFGVNSAIALSSDPLSSDPLLSGAPGFGSSVEFNQIGAAASVAVFDQSTLDSANGTFVVDDSGQVEIDFLFDGGSNEGKIGAFSLAGMGGLSKEAFIQEALQRVSNGLPDGQVVIDDSVEGAQFSGELGESDRNRGEIAQTKVLNLEVGSRFALVLIPSTADFGSGQPLFSIAALNPNNGIQIAQAIEGLYGMEDLPAGEGDADFNDLIFRIKGATSNALGLDQVADPALNWLDSPTTQLFVQGLQPGVSEPPVEVPVDNNPPVVETPPAEPPVIETPPVAEQPVEESPAEPAPPVEESPVSEEPPAEETPPVDPPSSPQFISDISGSANKFGPNTSESELKARGIDNIKIGTQTIYIGTQQVTSINQNPIIRSIDPVNPGNNWLRTDIETTGTDGRGLGIFWTGSALYGVFSVDGTQGSPSEDFRRAASGAQQQWLKSFGPGGGKKIAVLGQINPANGELLKAAHLSAVLQSGSTNSLSVENVSVNGAGNLVVNAKSFSNPRGVNGKPLTRVAGNSAGSPFDYTVEITPDLRRVVSTSAPGWQ